MTIQNGKALLFLLGSLIIGCSSSSESTDQKNADTAVSEAFIDAFYSFDQDSLKALLTNTDEGAESILFYQGWAEGGNYEVRQRHGCYISGDSTITCPVTVKDDLIQALELDLFVTDTFHLTVVDGDIIAIKTSSNDPPLFYEARKWVAENRPELTDRACSDDSGTPGDCVRGVVQGFREFIASR
jgi:hypothetical protein